MSWQDIIKSKSLDEVDQDIAMYINILNGYIPQIEEVYNEDDLNKIINSLVSMLQSTMRGN